MARFPGGVTTFWAECPSVSLIADMRFSSPDVELESFRPDRSDWAFVLQVRLIASEDGGSDSFAMTVCTPEWLGGPEPMQNSLPAPALGDALLPWGCLVVPSSHDFTRIEIAVRSLVTHCEAVAGNDWIQLRALLSRFVWWDEGDAWLERKYD